MDRKIAKFVKGAYYKLTKVDTSCNREYTAYICSKVYGWMVDENTIECVETTRDEYTKFHIQLSINRGYSLGLEDM